MGALSLVLLFWVVPVATSLFCYACVDKRIEYNPDLVPLLKMPSRMPSCSPGHSPMPDPESPSLWIVYCTNPCLSLDWKRNGHVTDRLRFCSKTLRIVKIDRYPGLENHLMLCDERLCNYSEGLDTRNAKLHENEDTESLPMGLYPLAGGSASTDAPSTTKRYVTKNPYLIKPTFTRSQYDFRWNRPRSTTAVSQIVMTIIIIILS